MKRFVAIACIVMMASTFAFANGGSQSGTAAGGVSGAPARITVEIFDRGTDGGKSDPTNNNWTDWIKAKILKDENIAVTFVPVNRWDETSAMNNLIAAGNPPDVCYTYNGDMVANYGRLGGIFDMAPYADTVLKDLKALLGPDLEIEGADNIRRFIDRDTGKVYMIPNRYMYTTAGNLFIRKDWLDKLGLPVPATPQQYYDTLVAFKEKDPGNVGKDKVIPFTMTTDVRFSAGIIVDSFIDPYLSTRDRWINTLVDRYIMLPGYKEGYRFLNKMYNNGLIDKDFPLYKSEDTMLNLIKSGVVGSLAGDWDKVYRENLAILTDLQKNIPGALYIPIDPMQSADGLTHKRGSSNVGGLVTFIPATAKNPDAAMRYINWLARYENYHFLQFGNEGVNHQIVNGVPKNIAASGGWIQNSGGNTDYTLCINGYNMNDPDLNARLVANSYPWPPEYIVEAYRISSLNAKPEPFVPATLTVAGPLTQTLADKSTTLFVQSVITTPANFDRVWDTGVADWLHPALRRCLMNVRPNISRPD
ncbi:hypothetical protein FACS189444_1520 [Spirochaetia bacterium]|nr:hypothetical protein FACS189444_1520 [Spirochaetia bacterium]